MPDHHLHTPAPPASASQRCSILPVLTVRRACSHTPRVERAPRGERKWASLRGSPLLEACLDIESTPALVAAARAFAGSTISQWELDQLRDDATLITSELVSNAVLHARTAMRLTLRSDGLGFLRIELFDENPRIPVVAPPLEGATSGRGLGLVASLATAWGTSSEREGKTVWAELGDRNQPPMDCLDLAGVLSGEEAVRRVDAAEGERPAPAG
ncbi:MAG TPA: ATP-binding protein [Solirubrobacterales bacterium]|nr:ATP-binding protein [Solirubrobacterales bacterium]